MRADVLAGPSQNEWAAAEARTLPSYHPYGLPSQNEWAAAEARTAAPTEPEA